MSGQKPNISADDVKEASEYIQKYWKALKRHNTIDNGTLIGLPNPYIVPSDSNSHFEFNEQYYWDSYFTVLGIDDEKLVTGMLENLTHQFNTFGLIPNANRYYFLSRSQPPILTSFIFHVYEKYGKSKSWLKKHITISQEGILKCMDVEYASPQ